MKSTLSIALMLILLISLSSCKSQDIFGDYSLKYSFSSMAYDTVSKENETISSEVEPSNNNRIKIVTFNNEINPGQFVSLEINGDPNTTYSIKVTYSSGLSKSKDLCDKKSNSLGIVSWKWRVGVNTLPGEYPVVISSGEQDLIKTHIVVKSKE